MHRRRSFMSNATVRPTKILDRKLLSPHYACTGPEPIDEMNALNIERKETAFIIADTPFRLQQA